MCKIVHKLTIGNEEGWGLSVDPRAPGTLLFGEACRRPGTGKTGGWHDVVSPC